MKFPVWRTAFNAFVFLWDQRNAVVRYGTLPLALNILTAFSIKASGVEAAYPLSASIFGSLIYLAVYTPVTIAWYRLTTFGADGITARPIFAFGQREWRLFWWQILLSFAMVAALLVSGIFIALIIAAGKATEYELLTTVIAFAFGALVVLAVGIMATRFSLAFVVVALENPTDFAKSWHMTEGADWRTLAGAIIIGAAGTLLAAPFLIVGFLAKAEEAQRGLPAYVEIVWINAIGLLALLALSTFLGQVYLMLIEHSATETTAEVAPP